MHIYKNCYYISKNDFFGAGMPLFANAISKMFYQCKKRNLLLPTILGNCAKRFGWKNIGGIYIVANDIDLGILGPIENYLPILDTVISKSHLCIGRGTSFGGIIVDLMKDFLFEGRYSVDCSLNDCILESNLDFYILQFSDNFIETYESKFIFAPDWYNKDRFQRFVEHFDKNKGPVFTDSILRINKYLSDGFDVDESYVDYYRNIFAFSMRNALIYNQNDIDKSAQWMVLREKKFGFNNKDKIASMLCKKEHVDFLNLVVEKIKNGN